MRSRIFPLFLVRLFIKLGRPWAGAAFWHPVVMASLLAVLGFSSLTVLGFGLLALDIPLHDLHPLLQVLIGSSGTFVSLSAAVAADALGDEPPASL